MSQAGQALKAPQPERLQAPQQDVDLAKASVPVEQKPEPASQRDVDDLRAAVTASASVSANVNVDGRDRDGKDWNWRDKDDDHDWDHDWDHRRVKQWDRDWIRYDDHYRPIICNPYHHPIKIIYVYDYRPRIVVIQPLASVVIGALAYGAYSFTALAVDAVATAASLAVGTFFGPGLLPVPYVAPPPLLTYDNVPVFVNYRNARYNPFLVRRIVDVGHDTVYGEHKVLLDGVTPVWGAWTQGPDGQRLFEVHKTQQFPGLDDPQEGPLPGDYQLTLANDSSGLSARAVYAIAASAVVVAVALCAAVVRFMLRRRPRALPLH